MICILRIDSPQVKNNLHLCTKQKLLFLEREKKYLSFCSVTSHWLEVYRDRGISRYCQHFLTRRLSICPTQTPQAAAAATAASAAHSWSQQAYVRRWITLRHLRHVWRHAHLQIYCSPNCIGLLCCWRNTLRLRSYRPTPSAKWRFLPRYMECRRGLTMRILSVRPSVCPSVKRVHCDETEKIYV